MAAGVAEESNQLSHPVTTISNSSSNNSSSNSLCLTEAEEAEDEAGASQVPTRLAAGVRATPFL